MSDKKDAAPQVPVAEASAEGLEPTIKATIKAIKDEIKVYFEINRWIFILVFLLLVAKNVIPIFLQDCKPIIEASIITSIEVVIIILGIYLVIIRVKRVVKSKPIEMVSTTKSSVTGRKIETEETNESE